MALKIHLGDSLIDLVGGKRRFYKLKGKCGENFIYFLFFFWYIFMLMLMCDVIWFSPKALPSLHCFVSIVVQFTPSVQRTQRMHKQPPKRPRKEKLQKKLLGKSEATMELFMNNLFLYLFLE